MTNTMSRWHLRVSKTPQGKEFSLESEDTQQRLAGRLGASHEEQLLLLRQQLEPHLAARRAGGERLELVVPDEGLRLGVALGALAPGGWDVLSLASEVKLTDERASEPPEDEPADAPMAGASPPPPAHPAGSPSTIAPAPLKYRDALHHLQRAAAWYGASAQETLRARDVAQGFPEARADSGAAAYQAIQWGDQTRKELQALDALARRHGAKAPETQAALKAAVQRVTWWTGFRAKALQTVERADAIRERWRARQGQPLSTVRAAAVEHRIHLLKPGPRWTLLIDEAGAMPEGEAAPTTGPRGRFVGLLVPEPSPLPALAKGWHAVDQRDPRSIDQVVQAVLDAPVGVLGLEVDALPPSLGDRWVTGVLELIRWVCRLLPLDGPTQLTVLIEQRGEYVARSSWKAAATEVLRHLAEQEPDRTRRIALDLRLVAKSDSGLNGYVDAVAFTWGSTAAASMARLRQSGLRGGCLHSADARVLRQGWEASGGRLSGKQWRALLRQPELEEPGSIPHLLLSRAQERCRQDPDFWQQLFDSVRTHLESKAIQLRELGREVAFLDSCVPQGRHFKPLMRLAWLTARLEKANHSGEVGSALDKELEALGARLYDEAPTLVCQADLDRAVLATNRFDFRGATRALARWMDVPAAVPGLRHWGRIQSSLGQHAAFSGLYAEAEQFFLSALKAFSLLSDEDTARAEKGQTATYLAIATMDTPGAPPELSRERVSAATSLSLDSIRRMARSAAPYEKFAHHLLVRFLVAHGSQEERRAYLAERADWRSGDGHPWPLIELYRALLLHEAGEAAEAGRHIQSGVELALAGDQGPVLAFIGLVIGRVGALLGLPAAGASPDLGTLRRTLPHAPWSAVDAAQEGRWSQGPRALLERCLPFNFR